MTAPITRRTLLSGLAAAGLAASVTAPTTASARPPSPGRRRRPRHTLMRWARDTWRSLDAMTGRSGLPADWVGRGLTSAERSSYTSPTNIGGYLWSCIVARDLGIIGRGEASHRIERTLDSIAGLKHNEASGMYYNWYDPKNGAVITTWPEDGNVVTPFLSSVDNGWLGAALHLVANADKRNRKRARRLFERMRWDAFNDPDFARPFTNHGGFFEVAPPGRTDGFWGNHIGVGPDVWLTNHHYDTCVSETRITTYLGIIRDQIPAKGYFTTWRTFPPDWTWPEMIPVGEWRTYEGVEVFEGAHTYRGMHIVPGWGGSMFEELMPDVFVPEARWAPRSWGLNHPLHVRAQREHGLDEAKYGYWGFSPSSDPYVNGGNGYREYGVDALGLKPDGYFSDEPPTDYNVVTNPTPAWNDGVVTPHASFLAMMHERGEAIENLRRIERDLKAYGRGGFYDAAATKSGKLSRRYLSLDQAMIMGALGNVIGDDLMHDYFADSTVRASLRPVIGQERFGAGLA